MTGPGNDSVRSHRDLKVWQKAMDLVVACYEISRSFPSDEKFGLCSQLQRSAVSIPANIAEGQARGSSKAYVQFLWIANASLAELETHILVSERLGYVSREQTASIHQLMSEVGRMLTGLRRSLEHRQPEP